MHIYAFLLSFNLQIFINIVLVSLPFYLVLSCHGIRILCQMPLLLTIFHVQNDFSRKPSSFFLETVLFHLLHVYLITTEMRNSFSVNISLRSRSKAFIPRVTRVTWYFLIFYIWKKNEINTTTQIPR